MLRRRPIAPVGPPSDWHVVGRVGVGLSLVAGLLIGSAAAIGYLSPPERSIGAVVAIGLFEAGPRRGERVTFARDGRRWVGDAADVPPGSVVHVRPIGFPGFFLLRAESGHAWAVADRNPHRGQAISWQDPLRQWEQDRTPPQAGFASSDGDFTPEGAVLSGPPPRPLDVFPTEVIGRQVAVAVAPCASVLGLDGQYTESARLLQGCEPHPPPRKPLWGTPAIWRDRTVTIDVGDGELCSLADLVADYRETRPDAMGDRFVGRVALRGDLVAAPIPPPGWVDVEPEHPLVDPPA